MQFWGKILTLKDDYFIVIGTKDDGNHQTLYSLNGFDWSILEDPSEEEINACRSIKGRFTGDPSFRYCVNQMSNCSSDQEKQDDGSEEESENPKNFIKEEIRLAVTVLDITSEAMLVPKNSSPDYTGYQTQIFSNSELNDIKNWNCGSANENCADMNEKYWSVQNHVNRFGAGSCFVLVQSLLWMGAMAVAVPGEGVYSKIYIGNGEKNLALPFMI